MSHARRVILHAGMPKTGSSALQVAFVRNRAELQRNGVGYPAARSDDRAERGDVVTGNAMFARRFLQELDPIDTVGARDRLVKTAQESPYPVTLYSTEFAYFAKAEPLTELRQHLDEVGVDLEVTLFVRDVLPWSLSRYAQHVQRSRFTGTFADFIDRHPLALRERLSTFVDVLGRDRVSVLHYESHKHDLLGAFTAEVLGLQGLLSAPVEAVNRTLDVREIEYMRLVNSLCDIKEISDAVGQALVLHPAAVSTPFLPTEHDLVSLQQRHGDSVAWVNREFFGGTPTLTVASPGARTRPATTSDPVVTDEEARLLATAVQLARTNAALIAVSEDRTARAIAQRDRARAQLQRTSQRAAQLGRQLARVQRRTERLQRRLTRAEERLFGMHESLSWRVTAPLRRLRRRGPRTPRPRG